MKTQVSQIFRGEVKNSKIVLETEGAKRRFESLMKGFEGQKIELSIEKQRRRRSLEQNNFYWGCIIPLIAEQVGMLDDETHRALALKFLKDNSKPLEIVRSTSELSKSEFVEYIFDIQVWASSFLGIENWPDPEEWKMGTPL